MIDYGYKVDFSALRSDLQARASSRMLVQFQQSPVLLSVLNALVSEIQVLFDAIVAVIEYRTLYMVYGINQEAIGRIIGLPREERKVTTSAIIQEDGQYIRTEDTDLDITGVQRSYQIPTDNRYCELLLLRILRDFTKYGSGPELLACIKTATEAAAGVLLVGPSQISVLVQEGTSQNIVDMLSLSANLYNADNIFLFPYPVTASIESVVVGGNILTEDDLNITTEDDLNITMENTPD